MYAVMYVKKNSIHTDTMRQILRNNNVQVTEAVVGETIVTEDVRALYPAYSDNTVVAIDGIFIGGLDELVKWANDRPMLLTE